MARIVTNFPKLCQRKQRRLFFPRPRPWAYFLNGPNAAASIAPTLIRHCQLVFGAIFWVISPEKCLLRLCSQMTVWCQSAKDKVTHCIISLRTFALASLDDSASAAIALCICTGRRTSLLHTDKTQRRAKVNFDKLILTPTFLLLLSHAHTVV